MEDLLNELVERLKVTYGDDLKSLVLYGSGAAKDHHKNFSDLNILCVLHHVGLAELRKACVERLRTEQAAGLVRSDIDAAAIANGMVTIILSLLMSVVQLGGGAAGTYGSDVTAVFEAALGRAGAGGRRRPGRSSTARPPRR